MTNKHTTEEELKFQPQGVRTHVCLSVTSRWDVGTEVTRQKHFINDNKLIFNIVFVDQSRCENVVTRSGNISTLTLRRLPHRK